LTLSAITSSDDLAGTTVDKVRASCRRLTEIVIDHGKYLAVYASEVNTLRDEDRKRTLAIRAEVDDRVSELIQRGCREKMFVADDPLIAARAVTGMISFMWTWAHPDDPASRTGLIEQMTRIALRALGVDE
jgi:TetR/AcrR family transcriptional regulator, cholesterol catabolism regulator